LYYSPMSDRGVEVARASRSFSNYLLDITRTSYTSSDPNLFERYLPFATSYGLLSQWIKYFQKHEASHVPAWFENFDTAPIESYTAFAAVMLAANTTGNTSSGATGYAGGAIGGGVAGGGASGAS